MEPLEVALPEVGVLADEVVHGWHTASLPGAHAAVGAAAIRERAPVDALKKRWRAAGVGRKSLQSMDTRGGRGSEWGDSTMRLLRLLPSPHRRAERGPWRSLP
ncbi:hypothetical protein GCM10022245_41080 [Streptomyces mayteni]